MEDRLAEDELDGSALCCCEYFDRNGERYHMLQCCCNLVDFDLAFDRLICCRSVNSITRNNMLLTFQDRLRIPWNGGAKQISLDTIIPIFLIPFVFGIAAINLFTTIIMFIAVIAFLGYSYYCLQCIPSSHSRFFFMWTICSVIYMIIIFEISVPLLEILPEENFSLILFLICAIFCLFKTKRKSQNNIVLQSLASKEDLPDIDEEQTTVLIDNDELDEHNPDICQICRKYVPPRTFHCLTCQSCIMRRDHHNYWLDCCIGLENYRYYFAGLWCSMIALFLTANLIMTSVCHPLLLFTILGIHILIPDDCTEIYDQYEMSLAFSVAIYACLIGIVIFIVIIGQLYLISKGLTLSEWRQEQTGNRKGIVWNMKNIFCRFR